MILTNDHHHHHTDDTDDDDDVTHDTQDTEQSSSSSSSSGVVSELAEQTWIDTFCRGGNDDDDEPNHHQPHHGWRIGELSEHRDWLLFDRDIFLARVRRYEDFGRAHGVGTPATLRFFWRPFRRHDDPWLLLQFVQHYPVVVEYKNVLSRDNFQDERVFRAFCKGVEALRRRQQQQQQQRRVVDPSLLSHAVVATISMKQFAPSLFTNANLMLLAIGKGLDVFPLIESSASLLWTRDSKTNKDFLLDDRTFCLAVPNHMVLPTHQGCLRYFSKRLRHDYTVLQAYCRVDAASLAVAAVDRPRNDADAAGEHQDLIRLACRSTTTNPLAVLDGWGPTTTAAAEAYCWIGDRDFMLTFFREFRQRPTTTGCLGGKEEAERLWQGVVESVAMTLVVWRRDLDVAAAALASYGYGCSLRRNGIIDDDSDHHAARNNLSAFIIKQTQSSLWPSLKGGGVFDSFSSTRQQSCVFRQFSHPQIWLKAFQIASSKELWQLLPLHLQTNVAFAWKLLLQSGPSLDLLTILEIQKAFPSIAADRTFWLRLACSDAFVGLPDSLKNDKGVVLHGCALDDPTILIQLLHQEPILQDRDVVTTILQTKATAWRILPYAVQSLYPELIAQAMTAMMTMKQGKDSSLSVGRVWAEHGLLRDVLIHRDIALAWCRFNRNLPPALLAPDYSIYMSYLQDPAFMLQVVEYNLYWLAHMPSSKGLCSDRQFMYQAVKVDPIVLCWACPDLKNDFELQLQAFSARADLPFRFISVSYTNDPEGGYLLVAQFASRVRAILREYGMLQEILGRAMSASTTAATNEESDYYVSLLNQGPETSAMYKDQLEECLFGKIVSAGEIRRVKQASTNLVQWGF
jgi:hypothetical protein